MDYVDEYYSNSHGCYPFETDENWTNTEKVIQYLQDCGLSEHELIRVIEESPVADCLRVELLPDWLWENSLIERNKFYYHSLLHIVSPPPSWSPLTGESKGGAFYLEMKIKFTMDELVRYFYRRFNVDLGLMDMKRDAAGFLYLMDRYRRLDVQVEPLDFVLALIEHGKSLGDEGQIHNIMDLKRFEKETLDELRARTAEAELAGANVIIWR